MLFMVLRWEFGGSVFLEEKDGNHAVLSNSVLPAFLRIQAHTEGIL